MPGVPQDSALLWQSGKRPSVAPSELYSRGQV